MNHKTQETGSGQKQKGELTKNDVDERAFTTPIPPQQAQQGAKRVLPSPEKADQGVTKKMDGKEDQIFDDIEGAGMDYGQHLEQHLSDNEY